MVKIKMPMPKTCSDCWAEYDYDSGFMFCCPFLYRQYHVDLSGYGITDEVRLTGRLKDCPLESDDS